MPRIRTIKPEFWTDEKIVDLSPWARLLYIGLWNFADDNGVLECKPKQIKMRIFPADNIEILPLLDELEKITLIYRYSVNDENYLICPNLAKHQVIDKPRKSSLPLPENYEIKRNQLKSTEIMLGREKEGKGKGIGNKKEKILKEKKSNGTYSDDFETFWSKKIHRPLDRKADAWKIWQRLSKIKKIPPMPALLSAVDKYNSDNQDKDPQFLTSTHKYLENELFLSPPVPPPESPRYAPVPNCPTCQGRGIVIISKPDGKSAARQCECINEQIKRDNHATESRTDNVSGTNSLGVNPPGL